MSGSVDTCYGDSGGPLVCVVDNQPVIYGVTSWGEGCGQPLSPGIYAKVSSFIGWLDAVIMGNYKQSQGCQKRFGLPQF